MVSLEIEIVTSLYSEVFTGTNLQVSSGLALKVPQSCDYVRTKGPGSRAGFQTKRKEEVRCATSQQTQQHTQSFVFD